MVPSRLTYSVYLIHYLVYLARSGVSTVPLQLHEFLQVFFDIYRPYYYRATVDRGVNLFNTKLLNHGVCQTSKRKFGASAILITYLLKLRYRLRPVEFDDVSRSKLSWPNVPELVVC